MACEEIEIVDMQDWINRREINKIALIKINIEGGEYELLDRLIETNLIEKIEDIQVQFHEMGTDSSIKNGKNTRKIKKNP